MDVLAHAAEPVPSRDEPTVALERLFAEHAQRALRAAFRVTGDAAAAEDVVQTVFLRLLRRDPPLTPGAEASAYLCRAAVNGALDHLRQRRHAPGPFSADVEPRDRTGRDPEAELVRRELAIALRSALAELPPKQAELFTLRHLEGLGTSEIAHLVGSSAGVVAVVLHRARRRLRRALARHAGGSS